MKDRSEEKFERVLKKLVPKPSEEYLSRLEETVLDQHRKLSEKPEKLGFASFFGSLRRFSLVATPIIVMLLVFTGFFMFNPGDLSKSYSESGRRDSFERVEDQPAAAPTTAPTPIAAPAMTVESLSIAADEEFADAPLDESLDDDLVLVEIPPSETAFQSLTSPE